FEFEGLRPGLYSLRVVTGREEEGSFGSQVLFIDTTLGSATGIRLQPEPTVRIEVDSLDFRKGSILLATDAAGKLAAWSWTQYPPAQLDLHPGDYTLELVDRRGNRRVRSLAVSSENETLQLSFKEQESR
ncbi:MAG: hypothetical protein AAF368_09200, partial [Planctomycetota bacterium]